jgi:hypothetical protein
MIEAVTGSHRVIALALCAGLALPAVADAQRQLGTDLNSHTPNANFDCRSRPSAIGPQFFGEPDNCTYVGSSPGAQSTGAPGVGVITRVRVKAAAPVGPMQVTVARAISSTSSGFACCFYQDESQVFTPAANATTTVGMRLPVASYYDIDNGYQVVDYLGLTVLANNVAIPGQYPGNNEFEGSLGFFPRLRPEDATSGRVDGYGNSLIPLLSADFVPVCPTGGAGSARAAQGGRCMGAAAFRGGSGRLQGTQARIPLVCNLTIPCQGRLSLRSNGGAGIGSTRFQIPAGGRRSVRVNLNRAGKNLVRGKQRVKVRARSSIQGARPMSRRVTLRR